MNPDLSADCVAVPRADLVLLLDWWMYPHPWKRAHVAPAARRIGNLIGATLPERSRCNCSYVHDDWCEALPCRWCNDEGIVHTHDGEIIGPCECADV